MNTCQLLQRGEKKEGYMYFFVCHEIGEIFGKGLADYDKSDIRKYLPELWSVRNKSVKPTSCVLWTKGIDSRIRALGRAVKKMS